MALEHADRVAARGEREGRGQPGDPAADDGHVDLLHRAQLRYPMAA